jgi:hypothetical protein
VSRARDVEHPEAAEAVATGLQARDGEDAVEARRVDTSDDRLLGPRAGNAPEGRDLPRPARIGEVEDADSLRRAVAPRAGAAREVRVVPLGDDVGAVAAARVDVSDDAERGGLAVFACVAAAVTPTASETTRKRRTATVC